MVVLVVVLLLLYGLWSKGCGRVRRAMASIHVAHGPWVLHYVVIIRYFPF